MDHEHLFNSLSNALHDLISSLKPAPEPIGETQHDLISFDRTESDNSRWKSLLAHHLARSISFEIHCWHEETDEISLALQYGDIKPSDWRHGTVIEGNITPQFCEMLLSTPMPADDGIVFKLTPFFSIFLSSGFSSSHYGTENYVPLP